MAKRKKTTVAYGAIFDWDLKEKSHERERQRPFAEKLRILDELLSPMPSMDELRARVAAESAENDESEAD